MRYYHVKYTNKVPNGFGGYARGPFIRIINKYLHDAGLLAHEVCHVQQWWAWVLGFALAGLYVALQVDLALGVALVANGVFMHGALYALVRRYRLMCEVMAYKKQLKVSRAQAARLLKV